MSVTQPEVVVMHPGLLLDTEASVMTPDSIFPFLFSCTPCVQVQDAATSVYNKIVPSAEAKEPSDARQHLNRAGDAAGDAGSDIRNSAYELKEAVKDGARQYGRDARER